MLEPKKIKYRKVHRGHRKGMAKGGTEVSFVPFEPLNSVGTDILLHKLNA